MKITCGQEKSPTPENFVYKTITPAAAAMEDLNKLGLFLSVGRYSDAVMGCLQALTSLVPSSSQSSNSPHTNSKFTAQYHRLHKRYTNIAALLRVLLPSLEGFVQQLLRSGGSEQAMWIWQRAIDIAEQCVNTSKSTKLPLPSSTSKDRDGNLEAAIENSSVMITAINEFKALKIAFGR